jgi:drug/metabolite transporter (DMT)-like permease
MICWGVSWPTSKILTEYTDTFTLMFLKFFLSSLTILPILFIYFKPKNIFHPKAIKPLLYATSFIVLYNIMFFYALKVGFAGLGGVIVTGSNPIFTFLLVAMIDKIKIVTRQKIGLILGVVGTIITVDLISIGFDNLFIGGNILFLIASLLWSFLTIYSTKAKEYLDSIVFTLYLYLFAALFSYIFFVPNDALIAIFTYDSIFWINLIFTTVITTGIATTFYFYATNILGAGATSSFIYLVPLVAVVSSSLLLGEIPTLSTIIGGAILLFSIYLINKKGD